MEAKAVKRFKARRLARNVSIGVALVTLGLLFGVGSAYALPDQSDPDYVDAGYKALKIVGMGLLLGFAAFSGIVKAHPPVPEVIKTPLQMGRIWMAWWSIATAMYLTKVYVIDKPTLPHFLIGHLPPQLFLLGCAFLAGWIYGRFYKFRTQLAVAKDGADEGIYEAALKELDGTDRRAGVWAKALAESDGDEAKAKAKYIQYRVQQIKAEAHAQARGVRKEKAVQQVQQSKLDPIPPEVRAQLSSPISAIQYANQRGMDAKELKELIDSGRIRSMIYKGVQYVESWSG